MIVGSQGTDNLTTERHKEILDGDRNILNLDCGIGYTDVYIVKTH